MSSKVVALQQYTTATWGTVLTFLGADANVPAAQYRAPEPNPFPPKVVGDWDLLDANGKWVIVHTTDWIVRDYDGFRVVSNAAKTTYFA